MSVKNNAIAQIDALLNEARSITSKPVLSKRDELRHVEVMATIKNLRASITTKEWQESRLESILKDAGLAELPRNVSASVELRSQWVKFIKQGGTDFSGAPRVPENRTNYQATQQWGRPAGLTWSDYAGDGNGTQGGVLVPHDYDSRLFASLGAVDEIVLEQNCNVYRSAHGSASTTVAIDDTAGTSPVAAVASQRISEAVRSTQPSDSGAGVAFDSVQWGSTPTYRSGIVYVATELDEDSLFSMAMVLESTFARRHSLAFGSDMIRGAGTKQVGVTETIPLGLTTSLPAGGVITTASSGVVALTDLENVYAQLPYQYRLGAKWYMSDLTSNVVAKLVETSSRNNGGSLDSLFGRDIVRCNSMNSVAAGSGAVVVFCHPDYILRREVVGGQFIRRFMESAGAIENGLVGYQGYARLDARPLLLGSALSPFASLNIKA